jgi:acetylornithine deacetylase/succinyl-diaminopimelate desuccinylase-like protein
MALPEILALLEQRREQHLTELTEWTAIPSISAQAQHAGDLRRACDWAADYCRAMGLETKIHPTAGHPAIIARHDTGADAPTVLLYGHYDVQPPEPLELWESPPFVDNWGSGEPLGGNAEPVRDGALYGRGASDNKGQIFAHLAALRAWFEVAGGPPVNLRLLIEGEEEIGSPHLGEFVKAHANELRAEWAVVSDGPMLSPEVPAISYGLRGLAYFQLDISAASVDLHSGTHGGAVPNPATALAEFIATLHNPDGSVNLPEFYDAVVPLEAAEREALAGLDFSDDEYLKGLGAPDLAGEAGYSTLERRWARPTLEVNGIWGGYTGEGAKTVLPACASAKLSCRLVPRQEPAAIEAALRRACAERLPVGVRWGLQVFAGAPAVLTPTDSPGVQAAMRALRAGFGAEPAFIREGGTIPVVADFQSVLGAQPLLIGFALAEDMPHSPNEHFRLDCLYSGIRTSAALWDELARLG